MSDAVERAGRVPAQIKRRGGARPGAGRPAGSKDTKTIEREAAIAARLDKLTEEGRELSAIDLLYTVMRDRETPLGVRIDIAKRLTQYERPALAAVSQTVRVEEKSFREMTDAELMKLINAPVKVLVGDDGTEREV